MKRKITSIAKYVCIAACVLLAAACSSKSTSELEGLIGDNATAAVFVSQDAIVKSFDIKDGVLPEDITRDGMSTQDRRQLEHILQLRGYDSKHILFLIIRIIILEKLYLRILKNTMSKKLNSWLL